jgi:glucosylceramidase
MRSSRAILAVLAAAMLMLAVAATPSAAAVGYNSLFQNANSRKCLEDLYYSTANFAPAGQYDCYGGLNQQWDMNRANGLIANRNSHKCLEVLGYSTANFAPVGQWDCHGGPNQVWWWR